MNEKICPDYICGKAIGRPRSETARQAILCAANNLLVRDGFENVTMEAIAATARVSKATLYRWWPSKSSVLMDAFLASTNPCCAALDTGNLHEDLRRRMHGLCRAFAGRTGTIIAGIVAEAQNDLETADVFRSQYLAPRRLEARDALARAQARGDIRADADLETAVDALFGPVYFRLLAGHASLTTEFADTLVVVLLDGLRTQ